MLAILSKTRNSSEQSKLKAQLARINTIEYHLQSPIPRRPVQTKKVKSLTIDSINQAYTGAMSTVANKPYSRPQVANNAGFVPLLPLHSVCAGPAHEAGDSELPSMMASWSAASRDQKVQRQHVTDLNVHSSALASGDHTACLSLFALATSCNKHRTKDAASSSPSLSAAHTPTISPPMLSRLLPPGSTPLFPPKFLNAGSLSINQSNPIANEKGSLSVQRKSSGQQPQPDSRKSHFLQLAKRTGGIMSMSHILHNDAQLKDSGCQQTNLFCV